MADDRLYVGYLPLPRRHKRFLKIVLPMATVAVAACAALMARGQRDPGTGTWRYGEYREVAGLLVSDPYPILLTADSTTPFGIRSFLLVGTTKFGADQRVAPFLGRDVVATATLLERQGRSMLELTAADGAIRLLDTAPAGSAPAIPIPPPPAESSRQVVRLQGEIIDPKCYLGAMKPGDGATHRACARLCLLGGIPPMFVTRTPDGRETFYLLTDPDGARVSTDLLQFVGDPVEITGEFERRADLLVIRLDPSSVTRL